MLSQRDAIKQRQKSNQAGCEVTSLKDLAALRHRHGGGLDRALDPHGSLPHGRVRQLNDCSFQLRAYEITYDANVAISRSLHRHGRLPRPRPCHPAHTTSYHGGRRPVYGPECLGSLSRPSKCILQSSPYRLVVLCLISEASRILSGSPTTEGSSECSLHGCR